MYQSTTYGNLELQQIPEKILDYYEKMKHYGTRFQIIVGSDSQTFDMLKLVNVVAVVCEGHGGIFFHEVTRLPRTVDVRQKLTEETNESLQVAITLADILEKDKYAELREVTDITIHVDASWNPKGKTKDYLQGILGWIKSCGFDALIKPDSFAASTIADKFSK